MAFVDSNSTLAEIEAAIDDNAAYDVNDSLTEAKNLIVACRLWLRQMPVSGAHGTASTTFNVQSIQAMLAAATRWHRARGGYNGGVKHLDLRGFRR